MFLDLQNVLIHVYKVYFNTNDCICPNASNGGHVEIQNGRHCNIIYILQLRLYDIQNLDFALQNIFLQVFKVYSKITVSKCASTSNPDHFYNVQIQNGRRLKNHLHCI